MRRFASALAVASLLGCSLAFAQAPTQPNAPPPSASPGESPGATAAPGESTGEHATTSGKHMSKKACSKQAKAKQLAGDEKKQFMKDCEHGKATTE